MTHTIRHANDMGDNATGMPGTDHQETTLDDHDCMKIRRAPGCTTLMRPHGDARIWRAPWVARDGRNGRLAHRYGNRPKRRVAQSWGRDDGTRKENPPVHDGNGGIG